jgi:YfiH family protein
MTPPPAKSARQPLPPATAPKGTTPRHPTPGIVTIPAFAAHPWLLAGFSTRQGGLSTAYAADGPPEQNLGYTPEDDPATILAARHRLVAALAKSRKPAPDLITIRQCHSGILRRVDRADLPLTTPEGKALLEGDALYTRDPNLLLGILTADCVPVLVADIRTHAVAAFHAGWRGTLARIVEHGIHTLRRDFGSNPQDLIAAIGPSIGACCFAIGEEVRHQFANEFTYASELFSDITSPTPQLHKNLWEANRRQLLAAGLAPSAITTLGHCTACTRLPDGRRQYFSHRAEQGHTGRMLSLIGATEN